ncbi:MAG TPA: carbon-nitrogen hydrolase [Bacteroidetes bacterium]|nr:carbon-nitrogen hydrolase [Bacteroidota bacterium]
MDTLGHKIELRVLTLEDYEALLDLQKRCFGNMEVTTKEQYESQLYQFQEGQMGVFFDDNLVGSSGSLILDLDEYTDTHTWDEIADEGYIRNHDIEGDTLYGIEVMVDPKYRDMKIGRRLYEARKDLAIKKNLKRILIGGRLPNYHKYQNEMDIYRYVREVMDKKIYDPVLTFQLKNGFVIKRIIKDYIKEDTMSGGYATLMEWANLEYRHAAPKRKISSQPVRICCVQYQMREIDNFEQFAQQVEYFVDVASDYKCDFVLLPELLTVQLLSFVKEQRPGLAARELTKFTDQYLELFNSMAIKYNVNIIGGSHFTMENDKVHNVSFLFRRDGTIESQHKIHVTPSERRWWGVQPGSEPRVFDTDRGRIAINICYDVEFPELARQCTDMGAQILFVPYCTDERHGYMRVRICAQARAIENQIYVAIAGTTGNIPSVPNMDIQYGQAAIFTPSDFPFARDGVAAMSEENAEMVVIADVDLEQLRRARHYGTVTPLRDRRSDLYTLKFEVVSDSKVIFPKETLNKNGENNTSSS